MHLPSTELSAEIIPHIKSRSAPVSEVSTPISRKRLDLGGVDAPDDGLFGITDLDEEEPRGRGSSILRRSRSSVTSREAVHGESHKKQFDCKWHKIQDDFNFLFAMNADWH